jgi:hypothetical protein
MLLLLLLPDLLQSCIRLLYQVADVQFLHLQEYIMNS